MAFTFVFLIVRCITLCVLPIFVFYFLFLITFQNILITSMLNFRNSLPSRMSTWSYLYYILTILQCHVSQGCLCTDVLNTSTVCEHLSIFSLTHQESPLCYIVTATGINIEKIGYLCSSNQASIILENFRQKRGTFKYMIVRVLN